MAVTVFIHTSHASLSDRKRCESEVTSVQSLILYPHQMMSTVKLYHVSTLIVKLSLGPALCRRPGIHKLDLLILTPSFSDKETN